MPPQGGRTERCQGRLGEIVAEEVAKRLVHEGRFGGAASHFA